MNFVCIDVEYEPHIDGAIPHVLIYDPFTLPCETLSDRILFDMKTDDNIFAVSDEDYAILMSDTSAAHHRAIQIMNTPLSERDE